MSARNSKRRYSQNRLRKAKLSKSVRFGILIAFVGILMLFSGTDQQGALTQISPESPNIPEVPELVEDVQVLADNLYTTPTGSKVTSVAPGTVEGLAGYAYVNDDDKRIIFADPINEIYNVLPLPTIGTLYQNTLIAFDMDQDTHTEFLVAHNNNTHTFVIGVDFNDGIVMQYLMTVPIIHEIVVGDFNGDLAYDFAVLDRTISDTIEFYNPHTETQLGTFTKGVNIDYIDVGRMVVPTEDSLVAIMNDTISVVRGNGAELYWTQTPNTIYGVKTFNHSITNVDDIAIALDVGAVAAIRGDTLVQIWGTGLVYQYTQDVYMKTGNFTGEGVDDLVVLSKEHDVAWFINGTGGAFYGANAEQLSGDYHFDVGKVDSDGLDDVALRNWVAQPTFIHGDGFGLGFTEEEAAGTENVYLYDLNFDGRQDIIACANYEVYCIISDTAIPVITPEPMNPLHPTALDDYFVMEYGIFEESSMEEARVYVRSAGSSTYSRQIDMQANAAGVKYFAFVMGFEAGHYEYYVHFVDSYRNEAFNGTPASPNTFEVIGNTAWELEVTDTQFGSSMHVIDKGNTSTGDTVIYTAKWNESGQLASVEKHSASGGILDTVNVSTGPTKVLDYAVYTAMMDGDSITDVILLTSNITGTYAYVYHGENMSLWYYSEFSTSIVDLTYLVFEDDDGDNLDELHILDNTLLNVTRMDDNGTWSTNFFATPQQIETGMIADSSGDGDWQIMTVTNRTRVD
ncbi:MAG: hypothetical protein ACW98Y_19665, partial [Candidatus Thorarchaeota archaeon]